MRRLLVIPAAGRGSRLGADKPKPLVNVNGRPMLDHLAELYRPVVADIVVIAHPSFVSDIQVWADAHDNVSVAVQNAPTGMLDAILLAGPAVRERRPDAIWITWADQVGVLPATVTRLAAADSRTPPPALALPTVMRPDPYTHFERDARGRLSRFLQRREGDRMPKEGESDMGLFALTRETFDTDLHDYAAAVLPGTDTGERNFVPFVPWLSQRKTVITFPCTHPNEAIGVNTREELALIEAWLRTRNGHHP